MGTPVAVGTMRLCCNLISKVEKKHKYHRCEVKLILVRVYFGSMQARGGF